jgi:hypothetical protein
MKGVIHSVVNSFRLVGGKIAEAIFLNDTVCFMGGFLFFYLFLSVVVYHPCSFNAERL